MNNFNKKHREKHLAFFDINIFAREGFTSGALIYVKEILLRLNRWGIPAEVLSIGHAQLSSRIKSKNKIDKYIDINEGIPVKEWVIKQSFHENPHLYIESIEKIFKNYNWGVVFINSPAVHLEDVYLAALKTAIAIAEEVVIILSDVLYPTYSTHPKKKVDKLYELLHKATVVAPSYFLIERFFRDTGIKAEFLPNLFTPENIISKTGNHEYITLINHHPMKGRDIFNAVAARMPHEKFLVIENWPDVSPYQPSSQNIKFKHFFNDIRELFGKTKILLVPSLCEEGCPRVVVESLLNGIPVIGHDIGGIPESGLGVIELIKPPLVEGELISPSISNENLDKQVNKFVSLIKKILEDEQSRIKKAEQFRIVAIKKVEIAEKRFYKFIKKRFYIKF
jgi:glycosyltransferase involved in cell wall biosynthesis